VLRCKVISLVRPVYPICTAGGTDSRKGVHGFWMCEVTNFERGVHEFRMRGSSRILDAGEHGFRRRGARRLDAGGSRILLVIACAQREVERWCERLSLGRCEGIGA
jgi:hypothetical protein